VGYDWDKLELVTRWDTSEILEEDSEDYDLIDFYWDNLLDDFSTELKQAYPKGDWLVNGYNLGWRYRSGHMDVKTNDARTMLEKILPKTDCTFNIYKNPDGSGFVIRNWHHDSPVGSEYYVLVPKGNFAQVASKALKNREHVQAGL